MMKYIDSISSIEGASNPDTAAACWQALCHHCSDAATDNTLKHLIEHAAGHAPYLARLIEKQPETIARMRTESAADIVRAVSDALADLEYAELKQAQFMKHLRLAKQQVAVVTALADIGGIMPVMEVTRSLSQFAEAAVRCAVRWLMTQAVIRGEIKACSADEASRGIIILGMGKLGAYELNYSSDIDLIVLFERDQLDYTGSRNIQHFMNKFAQDLVHILQERTEDGYVFRTDLRLRPDPMSTPPAVNTMMALHYYETVGQNWERAAMIKARPIAADDAAGDRFLRELVPYVWRKYLDFAAIDDIHSIKRQMNVTSGRDIVLYGHNIKTGAGGIREIEFFVQTQQLVWGGRLPHLRTRATLDGLSELTRTGLIGAAAEAELAESYCWFRRCEHALQMRHDEQTHTLPEDDEGMAWLSSFLGYASLSMFTKTCLMHLQRVHRYYLDSMEGGQPLASKGNLVFTGVEADPETLKTLEAMGYAQARAVSDIIQNWHRGSRKSTRSKRSRQVLTELVPQILKKLAETAQPDTAFFHFDDFLAKLPSGAQVFALFSMRPELLTLVADILGSAPALADTLSRDPTLLDAVMEPDFYAPLPTRNALLEQLRERVRHAPDYEQRMMMLRIFNNDKRFQADVHMLKQQISPAQAGAFLSELAEAVLEVTLQSLQDDLAQKYPGLADARYGVLALGKLGAREMSFGSDIDMVFLYDDAHADAELRTALHRLAQRLVSALTLLTSQGRLYDVDTRLRPGGADGPLATSLSGFTQYFAESAWTFELQALSKGRIIAANHAAMAEAAEKAIRSPLLISRAPDKVLADISDMRQRIAREHATRNPWNVKHVRGGLVDCEFIAQALVLCHAHKHPQILHAAASDVFAHASNAGLIDKDVADSLIQAQAYLSDMLSITRLMSEVTLTDDSMSHGLKRTLVQLLNMPSFDETKQRLLRTQAHVHAMFDSLITANSSQES